MTVLSIYVSLCVLAVVAGCLEVRRSFETHWEVRAGLFGLLLLFSLILLTTVDWEKGFRIGAAFGIAVAYMTGIVLGHKDTFVPKTNVKKKRQAPAKATVDFPLTGKDFTAEGYKDRNGNPVYFH